MESIIPSFLLGIYVVFVLIIIDMVRLFFFKKEKHPKLYKMRFLVIITLIIVLTSSYLVLIIVMPLLLRELFMKNTEEITDEP